jgi:hypothetical protein
VSQDLLFIPNQFKIGSKERIFATRLYFQSFKELLFLVFLCLIQKWAAKVQPFFIPATFFLFFSKKNLQKKDCKDITISCQSQIFFIRFFKNVLLKSGCKDRD